jgi:hypothetical protein
MRMPVEQWSAFRSEKELGAALRQLEYNVQAIHKRSEKSQKVRDLCLSLNEMAKALQEWYRLPGGVKIVVAYQPLLLPEDDSAWGEED